MENKSPSSCVSPAPTSTMSAGESSWAVHIASFLASSPQDRGMDQQAAVSGGSFSSGFSSSFNSFDDDASFITSELMCDDDEEDESLQDTACSSAAATKVATMENFDIKAMPIMDAKEFNMPQLAKYFEAVGSQQPVTKADQQLINSYSNNAKALYESNELRKKGLCLVPISMLINYLG
ncbi:hypothetical protein SEVIR_7G259000v4 [Setaria viridis]|uniref:Uncharacterized protein n=1 Tax=Setaria viridis TaxID=4556 RepID=A0A4U6TZM9_SETVI|nr:vascular-related unknown protein 1-like [Setaria viridis]TKW06723.1 hypothetical protein SEVIR_7G259000v2 [Setaria viridis]